MHEHYLLTNIVLYVCFSAGKVFSLFQPDLNSADLTLPGFVCSLVGQHLLPKSLAQNPSQSVGSSFPGRTCLTHSPGIPLPLGFNLPGPRLPKWEAHPPNMMFSIAPVLPACVGLLVNKTWKSEV